VATGRRWYLFAFCLERDDWRTFRLDRMTAPRATTWRFTPRDHPDAVDFVQRAISTGGYQHQARVVLHLDAEEARERVGPTTGSIEALGDGRCLLTLGADEHRWLAARLAWLGCDFEVLEPEELRDELAALGALLTRAATPSAPA
jgi:predicted DNA-binding transcriptional regulator YafY